MNRILFYSSSLSELHTISFLHLTANKPTQCQKYLYGAIQVPKSQPNPVAMEPAPSSEPNHSPQIQKEQSSSGDRPWQPQNPLEKVDRPKHRGTVCLEGRKIKCMGRKAVSVTSSVPGILEGQPMKDPGRWALCNSHYRQGCHTQFVGPT